METQYERAGSCAPVSSPGIPRPAAPRQQQTGRHSPPVHASAGFTAVPIRASGRRALRRYKNHDPRATALWHWLCESYTYAAEGKTVSLRCGEEAFTLHVAKGQALVSHRRAAAALGLTRQYVGHRLAALERGGFLTAQVIRTPGGRALATLVTDCCGVRGTAAPSAPASNVGRSLGRSLGRNLNQQTTGRDQGAPGAVSGAVSGNLNKDFPVEESSPPHPKSASAREGDLPSWVLFGPGRGEDSGARNVEPDGRTFGDAGKATPRGRNQEETESKGEPSPGPALPVLASFPSEAQEAHRLLVAAWRRVGLADTNITSQGYDRPESSQGPSTLSLTASALAEADPSRIAASMSAYEAKLRAAGTKDKYAKGFRNWFAHGTWREHLPPVDTPEASVVKAFLREQLPAGLESERWLASVSTAPGWDGAPEVAMAPALRDWLTHPFQSSILLELDQLMDQRATWVDQQIRQRVDFLLAQESEREEREAWKAPESAPRIEDRVEQGPVPAEEDETPGEAATGPLPVIVAQWNRLSGDVETVAGLSERLVDRIGSTVERLGVPVVLERLAVHFRRQAVGRDQDKGGTLRSAFSPGEWGLFSA